MFDFLIRFRLIKIYSKKVKNIIAKYNPRALVQPEDLPIFNSVFVKEFNDAQLDTYVLPFSISNTEETQKVVISKYKKSNINWIYKLCAPIVSKVDYTFVAYGLRYTYVDLTEVFLRRIFDIEPEVPGHFIGGKSKFVLINSKFQYNYFLNSSIREEKFIKYQSSVLRNLEKFHSNKINYLKENGLSNIDLNKPTIICSLPPLGNSWSIMPSGIKEFNSPIDLLNFIKGSIQELNIDCNFFFIHHPRTNLTKLDGFNFLNIDIEKIIPISSLYIAFASATIQFSIECGIPTLNYDIFNFDYSDFKNEDSVKTVFSQVDFKNSLRTLISNLKSKTFPANNFSTLKASDLFNRV